MLVRLSFLLFVSSLALLACHPQMGQPKSNYTWPLPEGFPLPKIPENNPMSEEKVALGRALFYDTRLSANQTMSCASCHQQSLAFAEPLATSVGSTGEVHRRNSLALVNIAYNATLTWSHDGIQTIERQLLLPMFGEEPIELGIAGHEDEILARFDMPQYRVLTEAAFPGQDLNFDLIVKALASFTRSLVSLNSPFDDYAYRAQDEAISESALRGLNLFFSERLECHHCHGGFNFTQSSSHERQPLDLKPFHNTGLYALDEEGRYPASDTGLYELTHDIRDMGRFRAPTLRNVELTAPYMHDGSIQTLEEVIEFYNQGGRLTAGGPNRGDGRLSPRKSNFIKALNLTEQEKADLLAFLQSLTDKSFVTNPEFGPPAWL